MKNIKSKNKIYIFDFDNTLSNRDSFVRFTLQMFNFSLFMKYWISVILLFPFYPKSKLKESFFKNLKGMEIKEFDSICHNFYKKRMMKLIKPSFLIYLELIDDDSDIVVVSASIKNYLKPWCDEMGFDLISTEIEVLNGKLTGRFSTPNCNGKEKVRRIKEKYDLSEFVEIHVFGNSKGDFPMLELGTHKYYKFFK